MQKLLLSIGADSSAVDNRQRTAKYYMDHVSELELPCAHKYRRGSRKAVPVKEGEELFERMNVQEGKILQNSALLRRQFETCKNSNLCNTKKLLLIWYIL